MCCCWHISRYRRRLLRYRLFCVCTASPLMHTRGPPASSEHSLNATGNSGTADRAKALELKDANEKAVEAEKKAAKLTAELALAKAQLQKEREKRGTENPVEVSTQQQRRSRTSSATSQKKAVSAINYLITLI